MISRPLYNIPKVIQTSASSVLGHCPIDLEVLMSLCPYVLMSLCPYVLMSLTFRPMMTPVLQTRFKGRESADERKRNRRKAEVQSRLPSGKSAGRNVRRRAGRADGRMCMDARGRADAGDAGMRVRMCVFGCWGVSFFSFSLFTFFFFVRPRVSWGFFLFFIVNIVFISIIYR